MAKNCAGQGCQDLFVPLIIGFLRVCVMEHFSSCSFCRSGLHGRQAKSIFCFFFVVWMLVACLPFNAEKCQLVLDTCEQIQFTKKTHKPFKASDTWLLKKSKFVYRNTSCISYSASPHFPPQYTWVYRQKLPKLLPYMFALWPTLEKTMLLLPPPFLHKP